MYFEIWKCWLSTCTLQNKVHVLVLIKIIARSTWLLDVDFIEWLQGWTTTQEKFIGVADTRTYFLWILSKKWTKTSETLSDLIFRSNTTAIRLPSARCTSLTVQDRVILSKCLTHTVFKHVKLWPKSRFYTKRNQMKLQWYKVVSRSTRAVASLLDKNK